MDTQAWLDQEDAAVATAIRRCGWYIACVGGAPCARPGCGCWDADETPFAYTVGLFGMDHPELLVFGLSPMTAGTVLNTLSERVRAGDTLLPGMMVTVEGWSHRIIPEVVPNPGDIVFSANRFYQRPDEHSVPVLQLSYDHTDGRFPWEGGHSTPDRQPRPGSFKA